MQSRRLHAALLLALTGAAACGAGPVPATPAGAQELLYVASQEDVTVAVIDMSTRQLDRIRLPYDIDRIDKRIQEESLPRYLADRLRIGK